MAVRNRSSVGRHHRSPPNGRARARGKDARSHWSPSRGKEPRQVDKGRTRTTPSRQRHHGSRKGNRDEIAESSSGRETSEGRDGNERVEREGGDNDPRSTKRSKSSHIRCRRGRSPEKRVQQRCQQATRKEDRNDNHQDSKPIKGGSGRSSIRSIFGKIGRSKSASKQGRRSATRKILAPPEKRVSAEASSRQNMQQKTDSTSGTEYNRKGDIHQRWYSKSDYARMHAKTQETIRMIQRGLPERIGICYRGLEHKKIPCVRTVNITKAFSLVLDQGMDGEEDLGPEDMAKRYAGITRYS
jgi:hypothetical protein